MKSHNMRLGRWEVLQRSYAVVLRSLALIAFLHLCSAAYAQFTIVGSPVPLSTLLQPNATLQVDDKLFSNFGLIPQGPPGSPLDPTRIFITPIKDFYGPGFMISGGFSATTLQLLQFNLLYSVTVTDPNFLISDVHLFFNGVANGDGQATVTESIFYGLNVNQINVFAQPASAQLSATFFLPTPQQTIDLILKDVIVNGGTQPGSFASVSIITQTFSQIPEPITFTMTLLGLGTLLLFRRRS